MSRLFAAAVLAALLATPRSPAHAAEAAHAAETRPAAPSKLQPFLKTPARSIALEHVRVIDGTGAEPREDETVLIEDGLIAAAGPAVKIPAGAERLDLRGRTVLPGLVGMHDHLFYPQGGGLFGEMGQSFPRLYLAAGVTTIRTGGSIEPYADLEIKALIDKGEQPGPRVFVTGPYLEGKGTWTPQMHQLRDEADARRTVDFWADQGATSFKAYNFLTRAELRAAVETAHKRGLKVTGHLCSIGFTEAAGLGIDNLEHGLVVDTELFPGKKPDECPAPPAVLAELSQHKAAEPKIAAIIAALVQHHVAVTSTLAVFDTQIPGHLDQSVDARVLQAMSPDARARLFERHLASAHAKVSWAALVRLEMDFELAFVRAGGLLLAGADPTGNGAVLAGYGDQRGLELLVDAGFTPLQAIRIGTLNGAIFLGEEARLGSIAPGKAADLVVVAGDPSKAIADLEKVELVIKDGRAYDPARLVESVRGLVGTR